MISIVQVKHSCDDDGQTTALQIKLKLVKKSEEDEVLTGVCLVSTISAAFVNTVLPVDKKDLKFSNDHKRDNIVDVDIRFEKENDMDFDSVASFLNAFKKALSETNLNFSGL